MSIGRKDSLSINEQKKEKRKLPKLFRRRKRKSQNQDALDKSNDSGSVGSMSLDSKANAKDNPGTASPSQQ